MASLVGGSNHYGLSSVVLDTSQPDTSRQTLPTPATMPPARPEDAVLISDDEENGHAAQEVEHLRTVRLQQPRQIYTTDGLTPSHARPGVEGSPLPWPAGKRQKLLDGSRALPLGASSAEVADPSDFTRAQLKFDSDQGGFTQAYPDFFADAFVSQSDPTSLPENDFSGVDGLIQEAARKKKKEVQPPYYDDPKLHIRMFRGPGCEHFALPVDSNPRYQELCDEFDQKMQLKEERRRAKQMRYNEFGPYIDESIEVNISDDEATLGKTPISSKEGECLAQILEVLPGVEHEFVLERIRAQHEPWNFSGEEIEVLPDVGAIVAELLEMENYPKAQKQQDEERDAFQDETGKTIKWDKDYRNYRDYQKDAIILLASQFDHVPTHYISKIISEKRTIWDAYIHINEVDTAYFLRKDQPYHRSRHPRIQLEKKYQRSMPYLDPQYYPSLVTELQAVRQHVARELLRWSWDQAKIGAESANLEEQKANGLILQCQCCFDDEVPMNRAVSCMASSGEHSFCFTCIESLANNQIGLMKHEMLCMDGSGCQEKLDMDGIGRAVPIKTLDRLLFNEQQAEIAAANIEGLEQCPFCDFKAICDPVEEDPVFSCRNPDCSKVTCRRCHEASHLPKTCEEVKKDRGLDARHRIEEARSEAMMRACPQCNKKIVKELGCNKLRCTCGAVICYVCKLDLSKLRDGYDHFSKGDRRCPLYDSRGIERHTQDADDAERKAIEKAKAEDDTIEESLLQIETGKRKAGAKMPAVAAPNPPVPHRQLQYRERFAAMREEMRERRRYRRAAAAPIVGFEPPEFNFGIPQYQAMQPQNAYGYNAAAQPVNPPFQANGLGIRHAELRQLQNQFMGNNAAPEQWRQAGGDLYDGTWQQRIAAVDNRFAVPPIEDQMDEHDMLATGNRIHNYRADMARRRGAQLQRRNTVQNNANQPSQFPNPAFLNLRDSVQPSPNLPHQVHPQVTGYQAQQQAQNLGGWLPEIPQEDGLLDPFTFDEGPDTGGMWRDQFRPPTPLPMNSDVAGRNSLIRRQISPDELFGFDRNLQHNRPVVPTAPSQPQPQPPYGRI